MSRQPKSVALLIPAVASLLSLAISTSAMAQRAGHRGAVAEQDNTVTVDDNNQDNRPRRRGEQVRTEQAQAPQVQEAQAPQIVREARVQPERMREENNQRSDNNPRVEAARQQQERENIRQRQQETQQIERNRQATDRDAVAARLAMQRNNAENAQNRQAADRDAVAARLAMQRNNAENARQNRQEQNERVDSRNERNDRDDNNGRGNRNDNNARDNDDNNRNRGNAIARKPYPQPDQRQWQAQQQRQANDYRRHLDGQQSTALRIVQNLRHQNRNEQYRSQQRYYDRMNQQRRHYDNDSHNDYYRGSYHYSPVIYRYNRGGSYYYANRYQADLMRQAINYGYEEGYYAGRADRMDRWGFNYRDAYAYQDANYGYSGYYVDRGTYNYYFRQGFSRGYDDGYYSRYRYGRHNNNNYSLNDSVFRLILNFSNWR